MKILKIKICNLTSIEGEYEIDFTKEPLRSAGLFAITGDTGAGKSTLLDAISLALYNSAPRFDDIENTPKADLERAAAVADEAQRPQERNVVNMLRRGQKKGGCAVTFSTADNETWEATWSVAMTKNGTYRSPERTLRRLSPKKEEVDRADIARRIEEVTHLNYEQFSRTVMLAQNSFSNFLKAKRNEKSALLEKLTGTEIYGEISQRIYERAGAADEAVRALENQMQGMLHDRLEPAALAELQDQITLLSARLKTTADAELAAKTQQSWLSEFDRLAAALDSCQKQEAEAARGVMEMRREELTLARYDELLPMQPLYHAIKMRRADLEQMKALQGTLATSAIALQKQQEAAHRQLDVAHERTADAQKQFAIRRPDIDRGHTIMGETTAAADLLRRQEEGLREAARTLDERNNYLASKREQLADAAKHVAAQRLRKQSLEVHRTMFDRFDLIKDKLGMLRTETQRGEQGRFELQEKTRRSSELKLQSEKAEKEQHDREARLGALKSTLLIHQQAVRGQDSTMLQRRAADSATRLSALRHAAALWQHISEGYARISERRAAAKREAVELQQKQTLLGRAEIEMKTLDEALDRVRTTCTLSNSENIQKLRKQLKEGQACPVCGATHHPYHTETERELGELLTSLGKELADLTERTAAKHQEVALLREAIASDAARIKADAAALADIEARQAADCQEWRQCDYLDPSFADTSATVNREARRLMIEALIDNTTRAVTEAERELATFNGHQQQINDLNEQITQLVTTMETAYTFIENLRTEHRIAAASAKELQAQIALCEKSTGELYADLDRMITLSSWFSLWKTNPDGFRTRLGDLHKDWIDTCAALEAGERRHDLLQEEIKGAEAGVAEARRQQTLAMQACDATRETLSGKQEELRRLFGNSTPAAETERLERAIAAAQEAEQRERVAMETVAAKLQGIEGQRTNLQKQYDDNMAQYRQSTEALDVSIARFNGSHSPVQFAELERVFSDTTNRTLQRAEIERRRSQWTLAKNRLETTRTAMTELQARPGRPADTEPATREALLAQLTALAAEMAQLQEQLVGARTRVLSHQNCEQRAAALMADIDAKRADALEWQRLNQLLGSADGKKFRTLAQSYTFGYLVEHANYHLRQLSPRYELAHVPGTLTLEIIDRDMFDRRRYVNSLSGGETFVVSLALALGLASLSSRNLAIGSLFIDEGFGNLDHASLTLVMEALSRLENAQGRKVGIISHTDQIRSQISPQIKLEKMPGGASRVEIG